MALNIISNFAANVATRNLARTDADVTASLAKLSSGTRVVSAKDDAASLAIGSRLRAEVAALKQASVNAGQASSLLQIADGAFSTISDILVRTKALAVQSASGQLSSTERSVLNAEFVALKDEITRISLDTEFNGTSLLKGDGLISNSVTSSTATLDTLLTLTGPANDTNFSFDILDSSGTVLGNVIYVVDVAGTDTFDSLTDLATEASLIVGITAQVIGSGTDFKLEIRSDTGDAISVAENNGGDLIAALNIAVASTSFTFQIGSGTVANVDTVGFSIGAGGTQALGIASNDILNVTTALLSITAVGSAIDKINSSRAGVGAAQNRLDFASSNLAASIENAEAARSQLLDLDVASEITNFTSKQVLLQAGVAMLAQANQLPQNLLRLLQ